MKSCMILESLYIKRIYLKYIKKALVLILIILLKELLKV
jgi:hypothetical protein